VLAREALQPLSEEAAAALCASLTAEWAGAEARNRLACRRAAEAALARAWAPAQRRVERESFVRVDWVAVPEALGARRVNRRRAGWRRWLARAHAGVGRRAGGAVGGGGGCSASVCPPPPRVGGALGSPTPSRTEAVALGSPYVSSVHSNLGSHHDQYVTRHADGLAWLSSSSSSHRS
jgi:hypothetical protein